MMNFGFTGCHSSLPSMQKLAVHAAGALAELEGYAHDLRRLESAPGEGPLVPGPSGKPLTIRAVQLRLKLWAKAAGVDDRLSPHWLRHTFAAEFCRVSVASPTETCVRLARLLGHADPRTCGHYLTMSRENDPGLAVEQVWRCRKRITKMQARRAYELRAG